MQAQELALKSPKFRDLSIRFPVSVHAGMGSAERVLVLMNILGAR
jgi:hypothetical protein